MTDMRYPFPKAIIFDWDNTLVDSFPVVYDAAVTAYKTFGVTPPTYEELLSCQGFSLRDSFPQIFGDKWEDARQAYLDAFEAMHLKRMKPMPDAFQMLKYAADKVDCLCVVSNKTGRILRDEADFLNWTPFFYSIVGSFDAPADKPAPDAAMFALKGTDIIDENGKLTAPVWFVGDGAVDMQCARNVGACGVYVSEKPFDEHTICVKNCTRLLDLLRSYE